MNSVLEAIHKELGITPDLLEGRQLEIFEEIPLESLVVAEVDYIGRPLCLEANAAKAWVNLKASALKDSVTLQSVSGFRSYTYQQVMIKNRLEQGRELKEILINVAAPGFSEHHTGRAIDLNSPGCEPITEDFENTKAFSWLAENAKDYGFTMSFPRDNPQGYIYEPWHWCFKG